MKLSSRDATLLAVIVVAILAAAVWYVMVRPATAELDTTRAELTPLVQESAQLREQLTRLASDDQAPEIDAAARLRIAKALPDHTAAPGTLVQLEWLAGRANVELAAISTTSATLYGGYVGTEYELQVTGSFFDVDDFLYRLHRQVEVNERETPTISGRLFATTTVELSPAGESGEAEEGIAAGSVNALVRVVAFSEAPAGASGGVLGATPAPVPAPAAPATTPVTGEAQSGATPAPVDPASTPSDPVAAESVAPSDRPYSPDPATDPASGPAGATTTTSTGAQG